jgi:hypothetical protein
VPVIDVDACSACLATLRACAERASTSSGEGCAAGDGLSHGSPGAASVGDASDGSAVGLVSVGDGSGVGLVSVGDGSGVGLVSVGDGSGVGLVSVGDGSEVGHASVGEGVGAGLGSADESVGLGSVGESVGLGSIGAGIGAGLVSVGEGSAEGEGLTVGAQVSVRGDAVPATARPPSAEPKAAVVASITARTQARRLTAVARGRAAVTRR